MKTIFILMLRLQESYLHYYTILQVDICLALDTDLCHDSNVKMLIKMNLIGLSFRYSILIETYDAPFESIRKGRAQ